MARLTFPSDRTVFRASAYVGSAFTSAAGATATIYADAAGTVLADVQNADGSANAAATFVVDANSQLPAFLGPASGADVLYVRYGAGSPVSALYAVSGPELASALAVETAARAAGDALAVQKAANLGDVASPSAALATLGGSPAPVATVPAWVAATLYPTPGQLVTQGGYFWSNKASHTSGASFSGVTNWVQLAPVLGTADGSAPLSVTAANTSYAPLPGSITKAAADAAYVPKNDLSAFNIWLPEKYGAAASYAAATDDTSSVQQAITASIAAGGQVRLGRVYKTPAGGLTASGRLVMKGTGHFDGSVTLGSGSGFEQSSATAVCLTISNGDSCILEDFGVINTAATPTASVGVQIVRGWFSHMSRVGTYGFWNNVEYQDACYYSVTDSVCLDPMNYGFYLHNPVNADYGETMFHGNTISLWKTSRNPAAAIRWESGGGLKFVNNKINGGLQPSPGSASAGFFARGFDIQIAGGITTTDLLISANSIENCSGYGIYLGQLPPYNGGFGNIAITGNELGYGGGGGIYVSNVPGVNITGNVFVQLVGHGIYASYAARLVIGPNEFNKVGTNGTTTAHIWIDTNCIDVAVSPTQGFYDDNKLIFVDASANDSNSHGPFATSRMEFSREVPLTTSTSVYTTLYRITTPQYQAGILEVSVTGNIKTLGAAMFQGKRTFNRAAANTALTTVGTDSTAGVLFDVLLDTTTIAGETQVKVRLNAAAGGTDLVARAHVSYVGALAAVRKGA